MKVVLFCGGFGMRLREYSESIPKPMVPIGYRPILWHVMKYYAHYGHKDFILCLGWKADVIKDYFLHYDECVSNDFVLSGGRKVSLLSSDIHDWNVTFVDTGLSSNIGQRLRAVQSHVEGDEMFLANYTDGLSDVHLPSMIDFARRRDWTATFVGVKPTSTFHMVQAHPDGEVSDMMPVTESGVRMNGGFFVLKREIFDVLRDGDELVNEPFTRLIEQGKLGMYEHDGFWSCMDTYKEKQTLDEMYARGTAVWEVWKNGVADMTPRPEAGPFPQQAPVRMQRQVRSTGSAGR